MLEIDRGAVRRRYEIKNCVFQCHEEEEEGGITMCAIVILKVRDVTVSQ